jgi:hypothetical protein
MYLTHLSDYSLCVGQPLNKINYKWENKTKNVELMLEKEQYCHAFVTDRSKDYCARLRKYNSESGTRTAESLT